MTKTHTKELKRSSTYYIAFTLLQSLILSSPNYLLMDTYKSAVIPLDPKLEGTSTCCLLRKF